MSLVLITFRVHRIRTGGWCVYVGMDLEKPAVEARQPERQPEGCLVVAIRIPVRIVVLVLVVPVRMVWDGLVAGGRLLTDAVLRPFGRALAWVARAVLVWPFVGLWRYVVVPLAKALGWLGNVVLVVPLVWLFRHVLTPLGQGIVWVIRGIGAGLGLDLRARADTCGARRAVAVPGDRRRARMGLRARAHTVGPRSAVGAQGNRDGDRRCRARGCTPSPRGSCGTWSSYPPSGCTRGSSRRSGRAIAWCVQGVAWLVSMVVTGIGFVLYWVLRLLLVLPALALWRWVLTPVGRVLPSSDARSVTRSGMPGASPGTSRSLSDGSWGPSFGWIFVEPVRWAYLTVLTPVGHCRTGRRSAARRRGRAQRGPGHPAGAGRGARLGTAGARRLPPDALRGVRRGASAGGPGAPAGTRKRRRTYSR